jgi:hypothetical protein
MAVLGGLAISYQRGTPVVSLVGTCRGRKPYRPGHHVPDTTSTPRPHGHRVVSSSVWIRPTTHNTSTQNYSTSTPDDSHPWKSCRAGHHVPDTTSSPDYSQHVHTKLLHVHTELLTTLTRPHGTTHNRVHTELARPQHVLLHVHTG